MRSIDSKFYKRKLWLDTRALYIASKYGLCERCSNAGNEVHHIIELNASNVNNHNIAYGFNNLELLCKNCHSQETFKAKPRTREGLSFDINGDLIQAI